MKIAVAQIDTLQGDLAGFASRVVAQSRLAHERGADLLVFPLSTITGSLAVPRGMREPYLADLSRSLNGLAGEVSCDCLMPLMLDDEETPYFEAVLLSGGKATRLSVKDHAGDALWRGLAALSGESAPADAGVITFEHAGSKLTCAFTFEQLDCVTSLDYHGDADVVLYCAAFGYAVDDVASAMGAGIVESQYRDFARDCNRWIVGICAVGNYGRQVFCGSSFALAPDGRLCACAAPFEEELMLAEVGRGVQLVSGAELAPDMYDERAYLWNALVLGLRSRVEKSGFTDVALALDGTLSSMALAGIAADALGSARVHVLDCVPHTHERRMLGAVLARTLRVDMREMDGAWTMLGRGSDALMRDLSRTFLAHFAREIGAFPLSALDKTGIALEDASACEPAFAPLGDVHRIDVLDICRMRNTMSAIFERVNLVASDVPYVGLPMPAYPDELLLEHMDDVLGLRVEGGRSLTEIVRSVGDEELAEAVVARLDARSSLPRPVSRVLAMTTMPLEDYFVSQGFAWSDSLEASRRRAVDGEATSLFAKADESGASGVEQRISFEVPGLEGSGSDDVRQALDLLREFSGSPSDPGAMWRNIFSEN